MNGVVDDGDRERRGTRDGVREEDPLLAVEELRIGFAGAATPAVDGISFAVPAGETLGLVGESGSGKSLTALALLGLLPPEARCTGRIRFDGSELLGASEAAMRRRRGREIAMIFQEPMTALNPVMRVGAQVAEAIRAHQPGMSRQELRERTIAALAEVALPEPERRERDYPHQFSGGQRQRIVIAIALANRPRLLIADEPTTALDVTVQAQILDLLRSLQRSHGLAMLFISHDLAVVRQVAGRVAVLEHGRVVEQGTAAVVFSSPEHAYTRRLLASVPTLRTDRSRPLATLV